MNETHSRAAMKQAALKTLKNMEMTIPIVIGVLLLVALVNPLLQSVYEKVFTGNYLIDPFIGALFGSLSFGIPIISYVVGGELLREHVSLLAVTAFMLTWSMVYVVMLPLEISALGRKFAFARNGLNFVSAIIIAILTVVTLHLLP